MDPRHKKRINILQNLFSYSFKPEITAFPNKEETLATQKIINQLTLIDEEIKKYAPKFPLEKIAKMDLAILRLSVYDLIINHKEPPKVIIDEAVELAKEFGSDKSFAFINAILGKIYNEITSSLRTK